MLELYSSHQLNQVPGFQKEHIESIRQRRKTLALMKDPNYIPNSKFVQSSKVLQLAFLDKIIEECDEEQDLNKIKEVMHKTKKLVAAQEEKIKLDNLKVDIDIHKDGDFEYQLKFDKSFYGRDNVNVLNKDRFNMRNKIVECLGKQQAKKGISGKSDLFWISKKKPFSKEFIKRFPNINLSANTGK